MFVRYLKIIFMLWLASQMGYGQDTKTIDMNFSWHFARGGHKGAYQKDFDDSKWRIVDIPHDWSIEDINGISGPLDKNAIGQYDVGYTVGSTGWYRKSFKLQKSDSAKIVHLQFDGIYMNADIWVNNYHAGSRAYGYSSFWLDITPYLKFGTDNVIAVEVNNIGMNSRWYSGSGIYRPVTLELLNKVHIAHWGTAVESFVTSKDLAKIKIRADIVNESQSAEQVVMESEILDAKGNSVAKIESSNNLAEKARLTIKQEVNIKSPVLWSVDRPVLYTLVQKLKNASQIIEERRIPFGIRYTEFSAEKGFLLNGQPMLLKGTCMHHDNYMLGSAAYRRAEERRVQLTKAAGYNAIRCAHNPPSQAFLEACDKAGILVIDEAFDQWTINKWDHDQDYGRHFQRWWKEDLKNMILRDRNHPSIIIWSIGNEIPEQGSAYGTVWANKLLEYVKNIDSTRPLTMAANNSGPVMDRFFSVLDIVGYNYRLNTYESDQQRVPDRVSYGSESFSRDAFDYWQKVEEWPYIIGDFVWTGWDYLGEASIGWTGYGPNWQGLGPYPWHAAYCGEIDLTGYKRPAAYYRDVLWKTGNNKVSAFVRSPEPSLMPAQDSSWNLYWTHPDIHPSWTWPGYEGKEMQVVVYSACDNVELFINGSSLGQKTTSVGTEYQTSWKVPYQPGELKVVGFIKGKKEAEWILKTAGAPDRIKLSVDREKIKADGHDLSYITAELYDQKGNRVYNWNDDLPVNFKIDGEGTLAGVGSGHPASTESFQQPYRKTFRGRCVAVVKSTQTAGTLKITCSAKGLSEDTVIIKTVP